MAAGHLRDRVDCNAFRHMVAVGVLINHETYLLLSVLNYAYATFQCTEGRSLLPLPLRPIIRALLLIDEAGVVSPMPPDAFVKVELVVKEEEEGLDLDDWFCAGSHGR